MPSDDDDDNYELFLPFGPPPVLPDLKSQVESYLLNPERLPIFDLDNTQKYWPRKPCPEDLFLAELCPCPTTLQVQRDPTTGKLLDFKEVPVQDSGCTAKNSTSMRRMPGPPEEAVRGSSTNFPFWPGGIPEPVKDDMKIDEDTEVDFENNLLTVPPGFSHGVNFGSPVEEASAAVESAESGTSKTPLQDQTMTENQALPESQATAEDQTVQQSQNKKVAQNTVLNLASVLQVEGDVLGLWKDTKKEEVKKVVKTEMPSLQMDVEIEDAEEIIPEDIGVPVLKISMTQSREIRAKGTEWAEPVDVMQPVTDFNQKIPEMAFTYPFELDTFQKQAILHLERKENVFVAAHTSAGKTVVAEYAIALSQKHMRKTIYTSPIKALSNQKFRDFKLKFKDVGLLTGDIQINQKATCLIMTTEILRSMLYKGSDIVRDLEWVIFDEVHYINDSERGVVWEEVLILLPHDVNIVMLSATVPNTMDFADWVGRTKKKKIYVISTQKRPVPLEHFLYTGSGGKSKDERFLLVDSSGNFLKSGHEAAVNAKKERQSKVQQSFGSKVPHSSLGPQQEKTIWIGLLDHLKRNDKLPVVAFTLSRNRCDQNSKLLINVDNTTEREKSAIDRIIQKSLKRLNETDRELPQVKHMRELLTKGIGVHHSGILPILKEIVEILFQEGFIKLLFATETFAMGVNMPARTVIFDSIQKHDGVSFRNLVPAEYIQMAGRAGRRGHDKTGTVVILCKSAVPEALDLREMMLGKPTKLESKFRLTYSMILNLLHVKELRVEEMMKRSFSEANQQRKFRSNQEKRIYLKEKVQEMTTVPGNEHEEIEKFYLAAKEYLSFKEELQSLILANPQAAKVLCSGRIIIISHQSHISKLGILLSVDRRSKDYIYEVFVLTDDSAVDEVSPSDTLDISLKAGKVVKKETTKDDKYFKYLGLAEENIFIPEGVHGHTILYMQAESVIDITDKTVKVDDEKVRSDWKKRQIPRFRDDPPGQSCTSAMLSLLKLSQSGRSGFQILDPCMNFKFRDINIFEKVTTLGKLKEKLAEVSCAHIPDFKEQFRIIYQKMKLKEELKKTEFLLSEDSLALMPDYHARLDVLRELKYISSADDTVKLKGHVACRMANHELLITELVFHNVFQDLEPEELSALLSSLVFQQKKCKEPNWKALKANGIIEGKKQFIKVAQLIEDTQKQCKLLDPVYYVEELNFGLVEVVYEWAKGIPFANIMDLTDVQEGIIVRCIQRLDEILRYVKEAANTVGNPILSRKMEEASAAIKRDIVFTASLYTQ